MFPYISNYPRCNYRASKRRTCGFESLVQPMMAEIEPKAYPGKNWWELESPYLVAGAINTTPFSGFGVRGTWVVFSANSWNTIDLTREENLYTAIESACRAEVSYG